MASNHVLQYPTQNFPLCAMLLFKVLDSPQRSSRRMCFVSVRDTLDMRIDTARLADVSLKTEPALAQVMPQACKLSDGFEVGRSEVCSQIAYRTKMFIQQMRIFPAAI